MAAKAVASKIGATGPEKIVVVPGPGGVGVDTVAVDSGRLTMRLSMLDCGKREILLTTVAVIGVAALHRRILPTVVCRPDARLDAGSIGRGERIADRRIQATRPLRSRARSRSL